MQKVIIDHNTLKAADRILASIKHSPFSHEEILLIRQNLNNAEPYIQSETPAPAPRQRAKAKK